MFRWVEIEKFDGGYAHPEGIAIGKESLNMIRYGVNIRTRAGNVKQRDGSSVYCDFSLAPAIMGETIEAIYEYQRESYSGGDTDIWNCIVFSLNGSGLLYFVEPDDHPNVSVLINSGDALSSHDFYAVVYFDHMFFGTGRDAIKTWDGITWSNAGIVAPTAPTLNAVNIAGTKSRKYKYTYYKDADPYPKESNASDELEVTLADDLPAVDIDINYTQATDSQVTHYYFYATEFYDPAVPATDFYFLGRKTLAQAIADGFVFPDTIVDADIIDNAAYDITDRGVPPQVKYMLLSDNRIFGAGDIANPSIIFYSAPGKPWYWPVNNWDEISRDDGDVITGLGSIGQTRYIFKQNSIWEWTGDPESVTPIRAVERPDATQNMTRLSIGCISPRSLASWGNTLIFKASDSHVYMLTTDQLIKLSEYIEPAVETLDDDAVACIHNDYYIIGSAGGTRVLACDLRRGKFGWEGYDSGISANCFLVDHNGYCLGSDNDQIIQYYNNAKTKDQELDFYKTFQSAYVKIGRANREGIARAVVVECSDQSCNLTIELYTEDGIVALDDSLYEVTDTVHYLGGKRADFISVRVQWEGTVVIEKVSYGWRYSRRH